MQRLFLLLLTALTAFAAPLQPALARSPAAVKLVDGFDGSGFSLAGGLYYRMSLVKRSGSGALELTVRSHCLPTETLCSERAEIWEKTRLRVPYTTPVWYGFAVKFADPVPQDDHRYLIAQWKREIGPGTVGDFSPFLAFRLNKGKLFITTETNYQPGVPATMTDGALGCPAGMTRTWLRPDVNQMRSLVIGDDRWSKDDGGEFTSCTDKVTVISHGNPLPDPASGWIDFAVRSQPGPDGDGHVEIFANGKWIVTIKGFIGHKDKGLGKNQYFKFGPYRDGAPDPWTLYYDDFRRSPDCMDVLGDKAACALVH